MASAFSEAQIENYLNYISLPTQYRDAISKRKLDLELLTALHVHQISAIPYENLALHYAKSRTVSLDPQRLYAKMTKNGRGGYCMENTVFFKHILLALGFDAYCAGARIRLRTDGVPQGDFIGWVHSVIIVTLPGGARYHLDVSFGGDGATMPLPLDESVISRNIGTQDIRLIRGYIPGQTRTSDPTQKLWIYQYRNAEDRPWNSFYAFPELEFFEPDYKVMNFYTSEFPDSFQRFQVLVVKFLRREAEPDIYGKVMLVNDQVKLNTGGKTSVVKVCETEQERIEALKTYFGISLTEEEKTAIQGYHTEIKKRT